MTIPWTAIIAGVVPSIGVGLLFWLAMRAIIHADRNERNALAELERQQAAADGTRHPDPATATSSEGNGIDRAEPAPGAPDDPSGAAVSQPTTQPPRTP